jgi:hypothetical protein
MSDVVTEAEGVITEIEGAATLDLAKIPASLLALAKSFAPRLVDTLVGFTPDRAAAFLVESREQHPEKDAAWHRDDAAGKFENFLREERRWGGIVDFFWGDLQPFAYEVVDTALAAGV